MTLSASQFSDLCERKRDLIPINHPTTSSRRLVCAQHVRRALVQRGPASGNKSKTILEIINCFGGALQPDGSSFHTAPLRATRCLCFIQIKLNYVCLHFFRPNEFRRRDPHVHTHDNFYLHNSAIYFSVCLAYVLGELLVVRSRLFSLSANETFIWSRTGRDKKSISGNLIN